MAPHSGREVSRGMVPIMRNMYVLCTTAAQPHEPYGAVEITVTQARSKLPNLIDLRSATAESYIARGTAGGSVLWCR